MVSEARARLIDGGIRLLERDGLQSLSVRNLAAEVGTSTMAVYTHFGGMTGVIDAVASEAFSRFSQALTEAPQTDDPVSDFFVMGGAYRAFALGNPQRYQLIFGAASPASVAGYRTDVTSAGGATDRAEWGSSFEALRNVVRRMIASGRIRDDGELNIAGRLWSLSHGAVMLELAGFFGHEGHGLTHILGPLTVDTLVGMGDRREDAVRSLAAALESRREHGPTIHPSSLTFDLGDQRMPAAVAIHFFLELAVILAACRLEGLVARRFGQPQVVGEMIAGVCLGPSLLGLFAPGVQGFLFPSGQANTVLYTMAQIGLVLYMFLIGLNFDVDLIRHRAGTAAAVSAAGILTPLALGALIAGPLLGAGTFFGEDVTLLMAMLFLGASIATTAFPMLARIIFEKRLSGTSLGTLALACGATDDALSWCILAIVLAMNRDNPATAVLAIGGGILYALIILTIGRRALSPLGPMTERQNTIGAPVLSTVLCLLMLCAWFTDVIGIYAIFGAFILGIAMPSGFFARRLTSTLDPLVTTFLLPLFFVYSGLNTQIGLVDSPALWAVTLGLLAASIVGKGVACTVAARLRKVPRRESVALGALMNARGLIELILLNIGLQAGIITPTLFTILVLVAIVTTLMASPIFEFVYGRHRPSEPPPDPLEAPPDCAPIARAENRPSDVVDGDVRD